MSVYVFDIAKMEEKVKLLFDNFINDNPHLTNISRINKIYEDILEYEFDGDYDHVSEYINVWNKDNDKVYIYIEEKDMKGYYFQPRIRKRSFL